MENNLPSYIKPTDQIILFDGVCKLCNSWSRFVIRFDKNKKFKLCSVQSEKGQEILKSFGYPIDQFDTMLLIKNGQAIEKSDSFLAIISQFQWPFNWLVIFKILPKALRDWFYDRIALNRYRLFGQYDVCVLATPDHEQRFL